VRYTPILDYIRTCAAAVVAVIAGCTAASAATSQWVRLLGATPHLNPGSTWSLRLTASRSAPLVVEARLGSRRVSSRAREVAPRRYRATLRLTAAGAWRITALFGGKRFRLATVHVTERGYALDQPAQVLQAPDGSLLVAERGARDRILRVDPGSGAFAVFATNVDDPWGLGYANDGSLLVSSDSGIYRVAANGGAAQRVLDLAASPFVALPNGDLLLAHIAWVGRLAAGATEPERFPLEVKAPHGMALAPDGALVITDTGNRRLLRLDLATLRASIVSAGGWTPLGLALEPSGSMLVVDFDQGTLVRVSPAGARSTLARGLRRPYALARSGDGTVFVVEAGELSHPSGALARVTADGSVTRLMLHSER
jgi:streptogramin lyase